LAFAYAIVGSSMWPIVGLLVPDKVSGMMYGAIFCFQQLGLSAASYVVGILVKSQGHGGMQQFFIACEAIGLAGGIFLIMRLGSSYSQFPQIDEKYKDEEKTPEELQTLSPQHDEKRNPEEFQN